jgi:hypothetical protein
MRLPREHQQSETDPGSHDRALQRSQSDATQDRLRHQQLPSPGRPNAANCPLLALEITRARALIGAVTQNRTYCPVITVRRQP